MEKYNFLNLTPEVLLERGITFIDELYRQSRRYLGELAEYSDNDEVFLLDDIRWAIEPKGNWLWEEKFKHMPVKKIIKIVANDHTNRTNKLQEME